MCCLGFLTGGVEWKKIRVCLKGAKVLCRQMAAEQLTSLLNREQRNGACWTQREGKMCTKSEREQSSGGVLERIVFYIFYSSISGSNTWFLFARNTSSTSATNPNDWTVLTLQSFYQLHDKYLCFSS